MEINYGLIIKYLVKNPSINPTNKPKTSDFLTQKNIFNYSVNFPDKFKNLLNDKFYRYGITVYDNENNNISFWSSILTLIEKNYIIPYSSDENELIAQFKLQLIEKYSKSKLSGFYKNLDKNDLRERFKLDPDIYILQYLVDILDINVLIMDWETEDIWSVFHKDIMNPWKKTILLAKYKKFWEPIMMVKSKGETKRLFDYNNQIIRKILTTENLIKYYQAEITNKEYILNDDIYSIIDSEKKKLNIVVVNNKPNLIETDSESSVKTEGSESNIFIKNDELEEYKKLNKTKLTKMKIDELHQIIDKLKIVITHKKPTKSVLVESILTRISA